MRIACIHVPQFALQGATRVDPALRGAAVAVVSGVEPGREAAGVLHAPIVLACSRAAWAFGVRLGMTALAARGLSPELQLVTADASNERETVRALADALLGVAPGVDIGGRVGAGGAHLAMYAEVPGKTRGAAFGERLLEVIDQLGLTARIGIADDRFTAWVAAAYGHHDERAGARLDDRAHGSARGDRPRVAMHGDRAHGSTQGDDQQHSVVVVPRGGSAAFLAPRPLSLLAISPEVQHMLEVLGVHTLGEFAALPAPSVARPLEADYRALARGESDATLRAYAPDAPIREEVAVSGGNVVELQDLLPAGEHARGMSFGGAASLVARRLALRLAGRGRGAVRLDVTTSGGERARELPITLAQGSADADELAHVLMSALETVAAEHASAHEDWRLRVIVVGEVLLGEVTEELAEGSQPYSVYAGDSAGQRAYSIFTHRGGAHGADADRSDERREHADDARDAGRGGRGSQRPGSDHPITDMIDPLTVVLSSPGSLFALSPPSVRSERRDAHRRTQRGKQRRSRPTPGVQPRLFDRTFSKE